MVGAGVGDDAVPDDGRVCGFVGAGPVGGDVDEEVLCVPGEEAGEVGLEGEADHGVLFLFRAVVMGTALDSVSPVSGCWEGREPNCTKTLTLGGCRA